MNQKPIKDVEEVEKNEGSGMDEFIATILFVLVLPLALAKYVTPRWAARPGVWRIKELKTEIRKAIAWAIPINFIALVITWNELKTQNWIFSCFGIIVLWISMVPGALAIASYELSVVQSEIFKGKFDLAILDAVRRAILTNAFARAHRIFSKFTFILPRENSREDKVIGITANPVDHRLRQDRKNAPDISTLTKYLDGDLINFPLNPKSSAHHLVIAATGAGKSHLLSRMGACALDANWRVVFIDFKGGRQERELFSTIGCDTMKKKPRVKNWPGDPIDLFRGSKEDIADRITGFLPAPTQGDGDFYRARMVRALWAVIVYTSAPAPTNVDEILNRVRNGNSFAERAEDRAIFGQKEKGIPVGDVIAEGLANRLDPLRGVGPRATHSGFSWSDPWETAVFSLDATKESDLRIGAAILHDFDSWLRTPMRQENPKPILFVVDEAGALGRINATHTLLNLVARGRSSGVSVVISSQTLASLQKIGEELLNTGPIRWLGQTPSPQEMIDATGTKHVVETSYGEGDNGWNGKRSGRAQRAYAVDPDVIRDLPKFYWNISEGGKNIYAYVPPLNYQEGL
jgi:TraM recognition site of TraD and TraG